MDSVIQTNLTKVKKMTIRGMSVWNPYFFLRKEVEEDVKKRHLKIWKGKYFDYTQKKEFNTLAEWVADASASMEDVFFGENRGDYEYASTIYITLKDLLLCFGYTMTAEVSQDIDDITAQMSKLMESKGLTIGHVHVRTDGDIYKWEEFMSM